MSSNIHPNFQDKKIKDEVHLVSEVLTFPSAVALSSQNVADLEKRGGTSGGVAISVDECSSSAIFSYGNDKRREMSMSPAWSDSSHT